METHLMMSLAYGKISASSTRLALAKKMIKVYEINDINAVYFCIA